MGQPATTTLHLRLHPDEEGWPPFGMEEVEGLELSAGRYRVTTPPTFTQTLAVGDVVAAEAREGVWWIRRVEVEGDRAVIWVITTRQHGPDEAIAVAERHGADVYRRLAGGHFLALDTGPDVDFGALLEELSAGEAAGRWYVAVGSWPSSYQA